MIEALRATVFYFLAPLIALYFFNFFFDLLIKQSILVRFYYPIIAPGIVIHELSHALAAIVTGAEIRDINLFSKSGGHVIHTQSKVPLIGQFIISFAPVVGQIVVILLLGRLLAPQLYSMSWHTMSLSDFGRVLQALDWLNWRTWILLYLTASAALAIAPSKKDLNNSFIGIVVASGAIFTLFYFNFLPSLEPYIRLIAPSLWLVVLFIGIVTILILPLVALRKVLGW